MRKRSLLVVALLVVGCKKEKTVPSAVAAPQAPETTAEQDALWQLAPKTALGGLVVSPRGVASLESGWLAIDNLFATAPELAGMRAQMTAELREVFPDGKLSLEAAGLTATKGAAIFFLPDHGQVVIVPVADRAKFLAVTKGTQGANGDTVDDLTCKPVKDVYACAKPVAVLDRLGGGRLAEHVTLAGARGEIELIAQNKDADPSAGPKYVAVVAQLSRGAFVLRGAVEGLPPIVTQMLATTGTRTVDPARAAGFAILNVAPLLAAAKVPPMPIVPGVTAADLANNIAGPVTIAVPPGAIAFDVHVPLKDTAPAQKLVEQCASLPPLAKVGAKVDHGVCHVTVPKLAFQVDAWIEGAELRIGKQGAAPAGVAVASTAAASELATGAWAFALYGRGTLLGKSAFPLPVDAMPQDAMLGIRMAMLLNEIGLGVRADGDTLRFVLSVRTAWSNPDEVVAKLLAIPADQILEGKATASANQIASASPSSPFAADFKAGLSGMLIPAATIGVLAAVAIPAFQDYLEKSKRVAEPAEVVEPAPTE